MQSKQFISASLENFIGKFSRLNDLYGKIFEWKFVGHHKNHLHLLLPYLNMRVTNEIITIKWILLENQHKFNGFYIPYCNKTDVQANPLSATCRWYSPFMCHKNHIAFHHGYMCQSHHVLTWSKGITRCLITQTQTH